MQYIKTVSLLIIIIIGGSFFICPPMKGLANQPINLQELIDQTDPNQTLTLTKGVYLGPVTINKPISIVAKEKVYLKNYENDQAAITIQANHVSITGLTIESRYYGIRAKEVEQILIKDTDISTLAENGMKATYIEQQGNGIDLRDVNNGKIVNNKISSMHDAIYVESGETIKIEKNHVNESRYGIHTMYTKDVQVIENIGYFNLTGAMIMVTDHATIRGNQFSKQRENVLSRGLLLYDVQDSSLEKNIFEGNLIGMYIENSTNNLFFQNQVIQNYIGIRFINSNGNQFNQNQFITNVIAAQAKESKDNDLDQNYWDAFKGIDIDGDGKSDVPYQINPFFQQLADKVSPFQVFFQSPGLPLLEGLMSSDTSQWTTDKEPLMNPVQSEDEQVYYNKTILIIGFLFLLLAVIQIKLFKEKKT